MSMYITPGQDFSYDTWNQMLISAAESRKEGEECKNICKVIRSARCSLELKTDAEIQNFFRTNGRWRARCTKMPLRDVLNITRISCLNNSDAKRHLQRYFSFW